MQARRVLIWSFAAIVAATAAVMAVATAVVLVLVGLATLKVR